MTRPSILICTVGTSLFRPNLDGLKKDLADGKIREDLRRLAQAYEHLDWSGVARELTRLPPDRAPMRRRDQLHRQHD